MTLWAGGWFVATLLAFSSCAQLGSEDPLPDFDALWDYDHPEETERQFLSILPRAQRSGDEDYELQLLTQIARTHSLRRACGTAHEILDRVEPRLGAERTVARARYHLERGRTHRTNSESASAIPHFESAYESAKGISADAFAVDALHMLAITPGAGDSLRWNDRAIALASASEEDAARKWLGSLYNNQGFALLDLERYEDALAAFQESYALRVERGEEERARIARWCIGHTLRRMGRVAEALSAQRALLADIEAVGADRDGYVFEEIGECLNALGRQEEARPFFGLAYELLSEMDWLVESEPERIERLRELGGG